jgi:GR25 family glycosyltransferase involved in LPS biosynthesis
MMIFKYGIVGIRSDAFSLREKLLNEYSKSAFVIAFDGFKGDLGSTHYSAWKSRAIMRRELSIGEVGCAMGHLLCYKDPSDFDWLIVFEDDVELHEDPVFIEHRLTKFGNNPMVVHLNDVDLAEDSAQLGRYPWHYRPYRTHAYALNKSAVQRILKFQSEIITTADWPVQWEYSIKFLWLANNVVSLKELPSLIDEGRVPLQADEHSHFQEFRSQNLFFLKISHFKVGKLIISGCYFCARVKTYFMMLRLPFIFKVKTSVARAYSDLLR